MLNKCDKLLESLKNFDGNLGNIRFKKAEIDTKNKVVNLFAVSDVAVSEDGLNFIKNSIKKEIPSSYGLELICQKSIADKDVTRRAILNFVKENYSSISFSVSDKNVVVFNSQTGINFEILVNDYTHDYLIRTPFLDNLTEYLSRNYSGNFNGNIKISEVDTSVAVYEEISVNESEIEKSDVRRYKVVDVLKTCDDVVYDTATYIADGFQTLGTVYFAGTVTSVEQKETKNGKPFYVITLDDTTSKISGRIFTSDKNKLKKLEKIGQGSTIIIRGENELYNGYVSLNVKGFHFCSFPNNFTVKPKPSKPAPERYSKIFPKSVETASQQNFFSLQTKLPSHFLNEVYAVVDIETTGTDIVNDKITEIGAVKIVNGVIVEEFQTLINPKVEIPKRIIELTGIDDNLVKNSPFFEDVYPDFFKFIQGANFVAHNSDFDFKMLQINGKKLGYVMDNNVIDTLELSRKLLPQLKRHKLNVVCEHYGITFHHHRALSDAYATAEMFIKLQGESNKN